jgi:hypothetical protein
VSEPRIWHNKIKKKLSRRDTKGMNVALIISKFSLASILFPPLLKRISVYHTESTEEKLNIDLFVYGEHRRKIKH